MSHRFTAAACVACRPRFGAVLGRIRTTPDASGRCPRQRAPARPKTTLMPLVPVKRRALRPACALPESRV